MTLGASGISVLPSILSFIKSLENNLTHMNKRKR
jgi:hypothetical protein